jgi:hypothetical protein
MAHLTVTITGSTLFPAAVQQGYSTLTDADLQRILNWSAAYNVGIINQMFNSPPVPGFTPTNTQIFQAWVQSWVNQSIQAEGSFSTTRPPPVVIGP